MKNTTEKQGFKDNSKILLIMVIFLGILLRIVLLVYGADYEGDAEIYARRGRDVLEGFTPYKDYVETKPPLWIASVVVWFYITTVKSGVSVKIMIIIADIVFLIGGLYLLDKGKNSENYDKLIFFIMIALNPMIIANGAYFGRYDIIPAAFSFLAFFLLRHQKEKLSALMLGIATMYKYLAAVFLLPLIVAIRTNVKRLEYLLIFSSICVLIIIPMYFIASLDRIIEDTVYYFSERSTRGIGIWKLISRLDISTGPSNTRFLIQIICLVIITVFMTSKRKFFNKDEAWMELFIIVFYVVYLLSNKIVLMQYFIFYLPFLALITSRNEINLPTKITVYVLNFITFLLLLLKNEYLDNILLLTLGVITVYIATILPLILIYKLLIKTKF